MKKRLIQHTIVFTALLFVLGASMVSAQTPGGGNTGGTGGTGTTGTGNGGGSPSVSVNLPNPFSGGTSLFGLVKTIINDLVLPIGGILAVLAFVYSGFLYVTAQGNESKIKDAHKALLYTAVGTGVLLGAWVLANAICQTISSIGGPACPT